MLLGAAQVPEFFIIEMFYLYFANIIEMFYLYFANRCLLWSLYLLSSGSFSNCTFTVYKHWKIVIW